MEQNSEISLEFFASGYCNSHANVVNPKSGKGKAKFYAIWALLYIPKTGFVLFDSGYSDEFLKVTQSFPSKIYSWITPVFVKEHETAKSILLQKGISTDEIKYVIISHFHADHISALKDFAKATFICSQSALEEVQKLKGIKAVSKGILHGLLPDDFYLRVKTIESLADKTHVSKEGFVEYYLFKNEYFKLVSLPGHANGMLGFIYDYYDKKIFFGADASWSYDTFHQNILPRKIVKLFFDSWSNYLETLNKIKFFQQNNPQFNILFTHCDKTLNHISNEI